MSNVTELATRDEIDDDLLVVDYVAGRLADKERADFDRRLASDADLQQAVDEERELRASLTAGSDVPVAAGFEQLRNQIEAERRTSYRISPAVAAGAAAFALVLLFMLQQPGGDTIPDNAAPVFTGLSEDPAVLAGSNRVTIVFAQGVTQAERAAVASQLGFELIDGPNPAGAWTAVTTPEVNRDDLSRWRDDPRIDLAEPQRYEEP